MARILRHKSWKSTQRYVHTIAFKDEDFDVTTATIPEEILALGKADRTKYDETVFNGIKIHFYRKPKRFQTAKNMVDKSTVGGISNNPPGGGDVSRNSLSPFSSRLERLYWKVVGEPNLLEVFE